MRLSESIVERGFSLVIVYTSSQGFYFKKRHFSFKYLSPFTYIYGCRCRLETRKHSGVLWSAFIHTCLFENSRTYHYRYCYRYGKYSNKMPFLVLPVYKLTDGLYEDHDWILILLGTQADLVLRSPLGRSHCLNYPLSSWIFFLLVIYIRAIFT